MLAYEAPFEVYEVWQGCLNVRVLVYVIFIRASGLTPSFHVHLRAERRIPKSIVTGKSMSVGRATALYLI